MANIFQKIRRNKIGYSTFNLSCDRKFSMNMGELVPCHVQEVVPGDKITMNSQQMLRFMPLIAPVMHEVNVFVHYFFVPNRIIWKHWEDFITGGEDGINSRLMVTTGYRSGIGGGNVFINPGDLGDHLGLPLNLTGSIAQYPEVSILPFLVYNKIWNDYYRDQNLQEASDFFNEQVTQEGHLDWDDLVAAGYTSLRRRAWMHDYFTSALPWAQKGTAVNLPIGDRADLMFNENAIEATKSWQVGLGVPSPDGEVSVGLDSNLKVGLGDQEMMLDVSGSHYVDLSSATATTIGDLRTAIQLQAWLERNARGGSRYIESIASHFDVMSSDKRLQRAEFLGGSMSPVMVSEVLQTSQTQDTPLAEMAGHGLNLGKSQGFSKFFEEHGYVMAICSVMPKTAYQQGIPRNYLKIDKFDYFWPEFQHIGEQEIFNKELMALVGPTSPYDVNGTFGYAPRYSEYKYNPNTVHGDFRESLDFWHLGRKFDVENPPQLNEDFVVSDPSNRIFAVEESSEQKLLVHMFHNIQAKRKMSYFGDPSIRL